MADRRPRRGGEGWGDGEKGAVWEPSQIQLHYRIPIPRERALLDVSLFFKFLRRINKLYDRKANLIDPTVLDLRLSFAPPSPANHTLPQLQEES